MKEFMVEFEEDVIIKGSDGSNSFTLFRNASGNDALLFISDRANRTVFNFRSHVSPAGASPPICALALGVRDKSGAFSVMGADGRPRIELIGNPESDNTVRILDNIGHETVKISGQSGTITVNGDIIIKSADCAEEFDTIEEEQIEPGTVMITGTTGKLRASTASYDKKVVGVISGAGGYKPGLILDKQEENNHRFPIALLGKVYCKIDANISPVEQGDLLTTSDTPGHAMKASDPLRSFGAVLGKALKPLEEGRDLIPILVSLQ